MSLVFTNDKLYNAYLQCRERKRNTINALRFEIEKEKRLYELLRELRNKTYKISRHVCFVVKTPNIREIFAADFRDRVVHHLLCNEINDLFEKQFINNSFANRKGKGTHAAVLQLIRYVQQTPGGYYLKLDISSFFCSINRHILYQLVSKPIEACEKSSSWKSDVLWLCQMIIFHDPCSNYAFKGSVADRCLVSKSKSLFYSNGKGLPIGNLTSQFFSNVYLNGVDHFITETLSCQRYLRYVDDLVIIDADKNVLKAMIRPISDYLEKTLDLRIKQSKTLLLPIRKGINYLGYFVKPTHVLVRQAIVGRLKNKLRQMAQSPVPDCKKVQRRVAMINSYFGHFRRARTFQLRRDMVENHFGNLRTYLEPQKEYLFVRPKRPRPRPAD